MKNPLMKRLPREFAGELGKYIVIFLLFVGSIGFVSGFLVADGSMIKAYDESFTKYEIEHGHFQTKEKISKEQIRTIEKENVTLYENFYVEEKVSNGSTLRIFKKRNQINQVCLMDGKMPDSKNEIAIDRMYADNNKISVGDNLHIGGKKLKVSGLVALSDYSALFSDNSDSMFDAVKFGVAVMSEDGYKSFGNRHKTYCYSWMYDKLPESEAKEKKKSEKLMKKINQTVILEDFVPQYLNQAIQFTGEDMGSDRSMMITLLYIVIAIMAFVFGVTISNTITKEANVIGTLRASGYTKGELVRHYMAMPIFVTLLGAVIGNLLGYTIFKDVCAAMYYGSYSLPTYQTIWNMDAFVLTTVVPLILMFIITFVILIRKLSLSPLQFIRRDLRRKQKKKAFRLNTKLKIFTRFRIRIIFQNFGNYGIMFIGIIFANLLLMFGLLMPSILDHYQNEITDNMLCQYQYVLKAPVETKEKDAEKFFLYTLETPKSRYKSDEISVYGVKKNSQYIDLDFNKSGVYISKGYAEKYQKTTGDTITLKEKYSDKKYKLKIAGIYDYPGTLSVFVEDKDFCKIFDEDSHNFSGYFSDKKIKDIDENRIASVIDKEDLTKISRQLDVSMGNMMIMVDGFAVIMFMILIYLLSKIIIEKNSASISMVKILGYSNGEISRLYILATSIVVIVCLLISLPIDYIIIKQLYLSIMMSSLSGWITFYINPVVYAKMFLLGFVTYSIVAALEYRRIQRVPLAEALKNAE